MCLCFTGQAIFKMFFPYLVVYSKLVIVAVIKTIGLIIVLVIIKTEFFHPLPSTLTMYGVVHVLCVRPR